MTIIPTRKQKKLLKKLLRKKDVKQQYMEEIEAINLEIKLLKIVDSLYKIIDKNISPNNLSKENSGKSIILRSEYKKGKYNVTEQFFFRYNIRPLCTYSKKHNKMSLCLSCPAYRETGNTCGQIAKILTTCSCFLGLEPFINWLLNAKENIISKLSSE